MVVHRTITSVFLVIRRLFWLSRAHGQPKFRTLVRIINTYRVFRGCMIQHRSVLQCWVGVGYVGQRSQQVTLARNVNLYHLKSYLHHKYVRRIQIQLDRLVPMTVKLRPSIQKWIGLSKLQRYFSFKTPSSPQFLMAVARCYNVWNVNTCSLRNARRTGLETSSVVLCKAFFLFSRDEYLVGL